MPLTPPRLFFRIARFVPLLVSLASLMAGSAHAAPGIEVRSAPSAASLALHPDVLGLTQFGGFAWIDAWQQGLGATTFVASSPPRGVAAAPDGTLYFATELAVAEHRPGEFLRWRSNLPVPITAVAVDARGGVYVLAGQELRIFPEGLGGPEHRLNVAGTLREADRIAVDPQGNVAFGKQSFGGGLAVVEDPLGSPRMRTYGSAEGLSSLAIRAIASDGDGRFVVGTKDGLFVATGFLPNLSFVRLSVADGLPSDSITALASDGRGGVAIGTGSGLALWDGNLAAPNILTLTQADGLAKNWVVSLAADGAGHIVAAHPGAFSIVTLDGPDPLPSDLDGDGFSVAEGDCNDTDAGIFPGAVEICSDGIDQDCSGLDEACLPPPDADGDGVPDTVDNCPALANRLQADLDGDGRGDLCDGDRDGDGVANDVDLCPDAPDPAQSDRDGDGLGDVCDPTPDPVADPPPGGDPVQLLERKPTQAEWSFIDRAPRTGRHPGLPMIWAGEWATGGFVGLFQVSLDGLPAGASLRSLAVEMTPSSLPSAAAMRLRLAAFELAGPLDAASSAELSEPYALAAAEAESPVPGEMLRFAFEGSALDALQAHASDGVLRFRIDGFEGYVRLDPATIRVELGYASGAADRLPPSVSLIAPAADLVSGTVVLEVAASDERGVTEVRFEADGVPLGSDTSVPYTLDWDTNTFPDGSVTLQAFAQDPSGNVGMSVPRTVEIRNSVPDTPPPPGTETFVALEPSQLGTWWTSMGFSALDRFFADRIRVGGLGFSRFLGLTAFSGATLPAGAEIVAARLELPPIDPLFAGTGPYRVELVDATTLDAASFAEFEAAPSRALLLERSGSELTASGSGVFELPAQAVTALAGAVSQGDVVLRLSGPADAFIGFDPPETPALTVGIR